MEVHLYQDLLTLNWNMLFSFITVIVLILILKKFFFEKVYNFMQDRKSEVETVLQEADETNQVARKKLAAYEAQLTGIEEEKRTIIQDAVKEAKIQAEDVVNQAHIRAEKERTKTAEIIQRDKAQAKKELQKEIGELAMLAAGKILGQELDASKQKDMINQILKEAEEKPWREKTMPE